MIMPGLYGVNRACPGVITVSLNPAQRAATAIAVAGLRLVTVGRQQVNAQLPMINRYPW